MFFKTGKQQTVRTKSSLSHWNLHSSIFCWNRLVALLISICNSSLPVPHLSRSPKYLSSPKNMFVILLRPFPYPWKLAVHALGSQDLHIFCSNYSFVFEDPSPIEKAIRLHFKTKDFLADQVFLVFSKLHSTNFHRRYSAASWETFV